MNGIGRRAVSDRNWKCGQINKVTWRAQLFLLKGKSIVDIKSNDDSGRILKEGTSDWGQKWKCCIEAKNISTYKVQFNVRLSQKSDLWTEGTSDRRRKWSFRIEATEARRRSSGQWTWRRGNAVDTHRHLFFPTSRKKSWPHLLQGVELGRKSTRSWHRYLPMKCMIEPNFLESAVGQQLLNGVLLSWNF